MFHLMIDCIKKRGKKTPQEPYSEFDINIISFSLF